MTLSAWTHPGYPVPITGATAALCWQPLLQGFHQGRREKPVWLCSEGLCPTPASLWHSPASALAGGEGNTWPGVQRGRKEPTLM